MLWRRNSIKKKASTSLSCLKEKDMLTIIVRCQVSRQYSLSQIQHIGLKGPCLPSRRDKVLLLAGFVARRHSVPYLDVSVYPKYVKQENGNLEWRFRQIKVVPLKLQQSQWQQPWFPRRWKCRVGNDSVCFICVSYVEPCYLSKYESKRPCL